MRRRQVFSTHDENAKASRESDFAFQTTTLDAQRGSGVECREGVAAYSRSNATFSLGRSSQTDKPDHGVG
jgi:hypothetical protein